jgi:hypothetical protein
LLRKWISLQNKNESANQTLHLTPRKAAVSLSGTYFGGAGELYR